MVQESERVYMVDDPEVRKKIIERTFSSIPHTKNIGLEFIELSRNQATGKLAYHEKLVGNIENGAVHTGVLISLIDSVAGMAVLAALPEFQVFVTLDLRVDCFKPSTPNKDLYGFAECYRLTKTIAFVRGSMYHDSPENPIAGCVASFFLTGKARSSYQTEKEEA